MLLTLLALAAPLPALALNSQGTEPVAATPAPAPLEVSTTLDNCGLIDTQVVCKLNVSFNQIPGATSYTAAVTRADGSVVDYGAIGAGGGSLWVTYVGPGNYSVRVSAYGAPPDSSHASAKELGERLATDKGTAKPRSGGDAGNAGVLDNPGARAGESRANATVTDDPGNDSGAAETPPASSCKPTTPATPAEPLPDPPPADNDPDNPDEDGDGIDDAKERADYELALSQQQQAALESQAALPEDVDCPAP